MPKVRFSDECSPSKITAQSPKANGMTASFSDECSPSKITAQSPKANGMTASFSDEGSPSKITVQSPEASGMTASTKDLLRRIELDNQTIQANSPLRMIELREKSVPGIGSLYGNGPTETIAPARTPRYETDSKKMSFQAMEEDRFMCKEVSEDMASRFGPKGKSIVQSIRRIQSKDKSTQDVEPIRTTEPVDSCFSPLSPIRKVKPANIIIPTMSPLRRSDSEETIVPTPDRNCRPSEETIVQTPVKTHRQSKDNGSPSLRKMRSAISILSPSPLAALKKLRPQATSLLRAMCFFDPTDIRERYLEAICARYSSKKGGLEATLSNFPVQPIDLQSTIDELKQEKLITSPAYSLGIRVKDEVRQEVLKQLKPEIFEVGFATAVFVLYELWPSMMEPQKSELRNSDTPSMMGPQKSEPNFDEYAKYNLWGGRDELVLHVMALESLFNKAKDVTRERCATRRYMVLLVEVAWYYFERVNYPEANQFVDAAFRTSKLACMVPKSLLANLHRTSAAIAFELGDTNRVNLEVEQFILLYPESFPQPRTDAVRTWRRGCPTADWAWTDNALLQSGLLAAAPDGVGISPWGLDEVEGFPQLAPFLSLRYFGWMNYAEGRYVDAAKCFLQCLGDRRSVFGSNDHVGPRRGELLYALGVVRKAQHNDEESFNYFTRALAQFQRADEDGPGQAKAHYKIAMHHINMEELYLADDHLAEAANFYMHNGTNDEYVPHLARVYLGTVHIEFMTGDNVTSIEAGLKRANEHLDKVSPKHRRRQVGPQAPQAPMLDAEVVIWAR